MLSRDRHDLAFHEVTSILPPLEGREYRKSYEKLKDDIDQNGQLDPIITYHGQIVDGRMRYQACLELGKTPQTDEWTGDEDSLLHVMLSRNIQRRHLTSGQRACIAVELLPRFEAEAKERQRRHGGTAPGVTSQDNSRSAREGRADDGAAKLAGSNPDYLRVALRAKREEPRTYEELRRGDITIAEVKKAQQKKDKPTGKPKRLPLNLDAITWGNADGTCCLATDLSAGFKYGIRSSDVNGICAYGDPGSNYCRERHRVVFVDNHYQKYDHDEHLDVVKRLRPKYATVPDLMTEAQCEDARIAFVSPEQKLEWAVEIAEHCQHPILIPKYAEAFDEIERTLPPEILDRTVFGFSVPTSYGGTDWSLLQKFKGRKIHLLGGTWPTLLAAMSEVGDDLVSIDFNAIHKDATHGRYVLPDGGDRQLRDQGLGDVDTVLATCLSISFGHIAHKIRELQGADTQRDGESEVQSG